MPSKLSLILTLLLLAPLPALHAANKSAQRTAKSGSSPRAQVAETLLATLEPVSTNGVFPAGKDIAVELRLTNQTAGEITGTIECNWMTDLADQPRTLAHSTDKFVARGGQDMARTFTFRPDAPGFYPVTTVVNMEGHGAVSNKLVAGYDVEHVQGPTACPPDFDAFWTARLQELAKVKPDYDVQPQPDQSTATLDTCSVTMRSYGGVKVRGWLTIPKGQGPWPGLVIVPGYGEALKPATTREQMVVLALNIRGHGNSTDDLNPGKAEFMYLGLTGNPADYVYVGAYLDVVRAFDFLCSRAEVDSHRLGIEGGSQGGGLAAAAAALDPRIKACAAYVPWLCDWPDYAVTAPWAIKNFPKLFDERKDLNQEKLLMILSYVDVMNLTGRIRCPVSVSMGLMDLTCPPRTILSACNRITAPKTIRFYPHGRHNGGGAEEKPLRERWLAEMLRVGSR